MSEAKQYLCSHLVALVRNGCRTSANMEKIWAGGATLNAEEFIEPGAALRLECADFTLDTHVAQCVREEDGFLIDIEFADGYAWTPELFEPKHLTDPDILLVRKLLSEITPR